MLPANQIVGFLNQLFLQNKLMKLPLYLNVDTNSQKLKVDPIFLLGMVNLISGLEIWLYLKNGLMRLTDFLQTITSSHNLKGDWKFFGCAWSKMGEASLVWWQTSWMDCIWRMNRCNKLIFSILIQIHKN